MAKYVDHRKKEYTPSSEYRSLKENIKTNGTQYDIDDSFIQSFYDDSASFISDSGTSLKNNGYSNAKSNYNSFLEKYWDLNERRGYITAYMNSIKDRMNADDYKSAMSYMDSFGKNSHSYFNAFRQQSKFYSSFKDEDDYNRYKIGWLNDVRKEDDEETYNYLYSPDMMKARRDYLKTIESRISELDELIEKASEEEAYNEAYSMDPRISAHSDLMKKESGEEKKNLVQEKEALVAEANQYKRSAQGVKDRYYEYTYKDDFEQDSKKRDYKNPTREEVEKQDAYSSGFYDMLEGRGIVGIDEKNGEYVLSDGTRVKSPDALVIPDKLGAYLSASEEEVTEAYNRLNANNGNSISTWDNLMQEGDTNRWHLLDENEIAIYYYLYDNQGQEAAYKFLDDMSVELGRRENENTSKAYNNASTLEKIGYNIATIPSNIIGGAAGYFEDAINMIQGKEINPYSAAHRLSNYSSIVRNETAEDIDELTNNASVPVLDFTLGDAYQALMSGADSLFGGKTIGRGFTVLMGAGASSQKAQDLYEMGATNTQIALSSVSAGVAEALFEYVSLDKLLSTTSTKSLGGMVKQVLAQGGVEASEEMATEIANTISDVLVMRSQSEWMKLYNEGGFQNAFNETLKNVLSSGLGGFVSGGAMSAGNSGLNLASYNNAMKVYGSDLYNSGVLDSYKDYANNHDVSANTQRLMRKMDKSVENSSDQGSGLSNKSYRSVGKFADSIDSSMLEDATKSEIKSQLERREMDASQSMVDSVYKYITSDSDIKIASKEVKSIGKELKGDSTFNVAVASRVAASKIRMFVDHSERKSNNASAEKAYEALNDRVSDAYTTVISETGEEVEIKKVESIDNGEMKLELSDGRIVNSKDIMYASEKDALVYESVLDIGCSEESANAIISSLKSISDESVSKYVLGVGEAYRYGLIGQNINTISKTGFASELTDTQLKFAYDLGRADSSTRSSQAQKALNSKKGKSKRKGRVLLSASVSSLTDRQRTSVAVVGRVVSDITHNNVVFYESVLKDGNRVFSKDIAGHKAGEAAPNGFYIRGNGTIYIDINAGNMGEGTILYTTSHELGHFIRQWSPEKFKVLADFLIEEYGKKGVDVNQLIQNQIEKAKKNGRSLSFDDAYEEVIADSLETMFTDTNLLEKLAKLKAKDATLWSKIKDFFKNLIAKIKEAYKGLDPQTQEGMYVKQMVDSIEKISDLFAEALVDAGDTFSSVDDSVTGEVDIDGDASTHIMSIRSTAEGAGLFFDFNEKTGEYKILDQKNGRPVTSVNTEQIKNSPLGNLVNIAVANNNITETEAEKQYVFLTDLVNMCLDNKYNFTMCWEIAGTQVFSAIKANSDTQYGKTIDFSTVCKKTQQIINVISGTQTRLKRGLTKEEIKNIVYNETGKAGEPTPCPVCYVFSRWMGIGGILQQMYDFQNKYSGYSESEIRDFMNSVESEIVKHANTPNKKGNLKSDFFDKNGKIKFGKVIADMKSKATSKINSANKAITRNANNMLAVQQNEALLAHASENESKKIRNKIEKLNKKIVDQNKLLQNLKDAEYTIKKYEEYQYLAKTYMDEVKAEDGSHIGWKMDQNFKPVDSDILFDLNKGAEFATMYPKSWKYRTTKGCNAGKAILPYSDARVGETIQGVSYSDVKDILVGEQNAFMNGDVDKQNEYIKKAVKKQLAQNLIGGMRYQSTSDFRFEYGSDYLITFLEMQAIGAKVQLYTKVIEAVDFLCTVGADVNMSVMPFEDGYITLPDGRKQLVFSSVTGINSDAAIAKSRQYDNAQLILVGINDEHIRLALNGDDVNGDIVTFVIPFHGSGNTVKAIQELMDLIGENLDVTKAKDYSAVQTDHFKKKRTQLQKDLWNLRVKIISRTSTVNGKSAAWDGTLSPAEYNLLNSEIGSKFLKDLYNRFYVDENADEYGVSLSKAQAEQIFPYEYWDKTLTYDQAYKNGERFKEYCESMGIIPRFSGLDSDGKSVGYGDFTNDPGYWKLLIDRKMYNNDGTFHVQRKINVTDFKSETLSPEWASVNYGDVMQKDTNPNKTNAIVENVISQLGNSYQKFSERVTDQNTLELLNKQLEKGEVTEVYRAMQVVQIDGKEKLVPPMAGKIAIKQPNGKNKWVWQNPSEIGVWEQSTEIKDFEDALARGIIIPTTYDDGRQGYSFKLKKGSKSPDGKPLTDVPAAYNPYIHTSLSVLNDQFLSAYKRPNLRIVKGYVPNSEVYGVDGKKYQAEYAKDSVGKTHWHSGVVASQMPETRVVILSRYFMPVEIMDDSDVALRIKNQMKGRDIEIPFNVVSPNLRKELEKEGVRIGEAQGLANPPKKDSVKYSDRDSDGNKLTKNQQEFFKDSKVRDEDGNLRVVYHGTTEEFTIFDRTKSRSNMDIQGSFFSPFDIDAGGYGEKVGAYYLNIKNPAPEGIGYKALNRFKGQNGAGIKAREYLESLGYDGVNNGDEEYIAFYPEQIKKIDNKNPTSGPDIRYSDRNPSLDRRTLLANALETTAQNDIEKKYISDYKANIDMINAEQEKLAKLRSEIKDMSFQKGVRDDAWKQKMSNLRDESTKTANRINTYDKKLLKLESAKPLQDVLNREKDAAVKKAEEEGRKALNSYREKATKAQRELLERWKESRKKGIDSRNRTAMRHKIKGVVNELNQYLLRGTKERHVPIGLQKAVAESLDAVNMDTVGAEERISNLQKELMKAKTPEDIQEISRKIDRIREMGDKMSEKLNKLKEAYDDIVNSDDPLIANSHDDVISNKLQAVIDSVGDTPLRDMNLSQLEDVYDMYRMVLTTIRNANKAFKAKKSDNISIIANNVMMELKHSGGKKKLRRKGTEGINRFFWNNLKPVYAFEHIGSDHFTDVFNAVRAGEDVWAVDVTEAREYYLDKVKKYKYDSWDLKKRYTFTSTSGMEFSLDIEQIMSLYAYSKRDQAADHLKKGGIVIDEATEITVKNKLGIPVKFNPTEATAYNLSDKILSDIISKLTDEQKQFVDEMQDYLSTVMGEKGNEVSLEMYGVKLFKEKFYFPLKSAQQFMAKAKEQQKGEVKIKNSGFSKETVQKASNPIVLTPFMNVWADHVNDMSMYHAFVLPMEDFYRVYNYKTPTSENMATESVEMSIQNAYGRAATAYIDQLLKDLNGGARTDHTTGIINKAMGLFKKGAVFASMSVVIQQPSAIARAAALVNPKYFIGSKVDHKRHKQLWAEVKKYAPVAIIKEMGYFDTNMGKSTQDFIMGKEYSGFTSKMKALFTDSGFRDEVLSKAPALADEIAWCGIWEAVKRETKANNRSMNTSSEEFLKKVGERFTEVIVKTQVYDSVLSRSGMMRSKDTGMKMATAFMAEPTTSINMIADALLKGKRGNRKYAIGAIGAVIASQILNSILVSFVYAGRDDDEDETYIEKYIGTLTGEILDSLNPAEYIPFIKDIMSIVRGYDVERSDMAVISDLWKAWENLSKDNMSTYRKVEGFAGSIAQIFGLPVKNIMRDTRGIYQTIESFVNGQQTTSSGIKYAIQGAVTGKTVSNYQQLYEAIMSGDQTQIDRVKGRFDDQTSINSAIRKALRENDPRIHEAALAWNENDLEEYMRIAKQIIAENHFSQDDVVMAIRSEANSLISDDTEGNSKVHGLFTADNFKEAISQGDMAIANDIRDDLIQTAQDNGKSLEEAENSVNKSIKSSIMELFSEDIITKETAIDLISQYAGMEWEEAEKSVNNSIKRNIMELLSEGSITKETAIDLIASDAGMEWEEAEKSVNNSIKSSIQEQFEDGSITKETAIDLLVSDGGMEWSDAESRVQYWEFTADNPSADISEGAVNKYYTDIEPSGISVDVYIDYYDQKKTVKGVDADGDGKTDSGSKKIQILYIIDSLPISDYQKDVLYYAEGWSEKTISDAPWH